MAHTTLVVGRIYQSPITPNAGFIGREVWKECRRIRCLMCVTEQSGIAYMICMIETHEMRFGNALYFNEIYRDFSTQYLSYHI